MEEEGGGDRDPSGSAGPLWGLIRTFPGSGHIVGAKGTDMAQKRPPTSGTGLGEGALWQDPEPTALSSLLSHKEGLGDGTRIPTERTPRREAPSGSSLWLGPRAIVSPTPERPQAAAQGSFEGTASSSEHDGAGQEAPGQLATEVGVAAGHRDGELSPGSRRTPQARQDREHLPSWGPAGPMGGPGSLLRGA